jgi:hypothetical protein
MSECGVHLGERQAPEISCDLFRRLAHVVQNGNPANCNTRSSDARAAIVNTGAPRDETADFDPACH